MKALFTALIVLGAVSANAAAEAHFEGKLLRLNGETTSSEFVIEADEALVNLSNTALTGKWTRKFQVPTITDRKSGKTYRVTRFHNGDNICKLLDESRPYNVETSKSQSLVETLFGVDAVSVEIDDDGTIKVTEQPKHGSEVLNGLLCRTEPVPSCC